MMKKVLIYSGLIVAGVLVVITFITATNYTQLAIATLLYPPLMYYVFKYFPAKSQNEPSEKLVVALQPVNNPDPTKREVDIVDIDKRAFLKLVGAAGFSFFLFSIFTKKVEGLLLGNSTGSGSSVLEDRTGNQINPAEKEPTDGYKISEIDNNESTYYGFINKDGGWYVMKEDPDSGSFRYVRGDTDFPGNWARRENLTYDYFHNVFY